MPGGNSHSAAGQALGYVHQCLWALVELGRRTQNDPTVELRLETLDDIQFDLDGAPIELLQVKHHFGPNASLSASSVDLWRTLNVWMDLPEGDSTILRLVTTQHVPPAGDLRGLTEAEWNVQAALTAITSAAESSSNLATRQWRERFLGLDVRQREALISRIVLDDAAPHASDLNEELVRTFRYAIPTGRQEVFIDQLLGRWAVLAISLLDRSLTAVSGVDIISAVADIADQLRPDALPIDPATSQRFDPQHAVAYHQRQFVQQLRWIALDENRLWKAIRDYHRSYTQRSYWLRHQLISEIELDRFAFRLRDEWESVFDRNVARMRRLGRTDMEVVGQEIWEDLAEQSRVRIRDRFEESWFSRGVFHAMADGELGIADDPIGWHPEFIEKLEELLSDAQ
ncbi:MAG: ABC-three component system protein [Lacisediminihabitans sp.]